MVNYILLAKNIIQWIHEAENRETYRARLKYLYQLAHQINYMNRLQTREVISYASEDPLWLTILDRVIPNDTPTFPSDIASITLSVQRTLDDPRQRYFLTDPYSIELANLRDQLSHIILWITDNNLYYHPDHVVIEMIALFERTRNTSQQDIFYTIARDYYHHFTESQLLLWPVNSKVILAQARYAEALGIYSLRDYLIQVRKRYLNQESPEWPTIAEGLKQYEFNLYGPN